MLRIGIAAGAGVAALIVLGITLWFLGDATMLALESVGFRSASAAALTGVAGLVLIGLLALVARLALHPHRRPALSATRPAAGANGVASGIAADLGALAAQQIVSTTREHPYGTMGAALAAGIAVGALPELRQALTGLFKH
jgi:hypothetical protein